MSELIPWLFLLPPVLVACAALAALGWRKTTRGQAKSLLGDGGRHLYRKEYEEAERCFQEGLKLDPENSALIGTLASLYVTLDRHEEAMPLVRKAITKQPTDSRLTVILGRCLYERGDQEEALKTWGEIAEDSESYLEVQQIIAAHYSGNGDIERAVQILEAAAESGSGDALQLRELKRELRKLKRAIKTANTAPENQVKDDHAATSPRRRARARKTT